MTDEELFWARVDKSGDCWEWQGYRNGQGYGEWFDGYRTLAHRAAWTFMHGKIPAGRIIRHTCDNPPCVRPSHLLIGTLITSRTRWRGIGRRRASATAGLG